MSQSNYNEFIEAEKKYAESLRKLSVRMEYILRYIFGDNLKWWDWQSGDTNYRSGIGGPCISSDTIQYYAEFSNYSRKCIVLKDGTEWMLDEIPLEWLWEDFEEEYTKGLELFQQREEERKIKEKEHKKEKEYKKRTLAEQAKSKLTQEEIKALLSCKEN